MSAQGYRDRDEDVIGIQFPSNGKVALYRADRMMMMITKEQAATLAKTILIKLGWTLKEEDGAG